MAKQYSAFKTAYNQTVDDRPNADPNSKPSTTMCHWRTLC